MVIDTEFIFTIIGARSSTQHRSLRLTITGQLSVLLDTMVNCEPHCMFTVIVIMTGVPGIIIIVQGYMMDQMRVINQIRYV